MNTFKDYQFASRQRDARREHRRSRGVKGIDLMRDKALALKPTSKHAKGHLQAVGPKQLKDQAERQALKFARRYPYAGAAAGHEASRELLRLPYCGGKRQAALFEGLS